jgi:hypothetical protein
VVVRDHLFRARRRPCFDTRDGPGKIAKVPPPQGARTILTGFMRVKNRRIADKRLKIKTNPSSGDGCYKAPFRAASPSIDRPRRGRASAPGRSSIEQQW